MLVHFDKYTDNKKISKIYPLNNKDRVSKVIKDFKASNSLVDFFKQMNKNPEMVKINASVYEMGNCRLCFGSSINLEDSINNLLFVNNYHLSSAPKLLNYSFNKNDKYAMMVFDMPHLTPYNEAQKTLQDSSKKQFLSDLMNFSRKTGCYNPAALDSNNWFVSDNGIIMISDWSELEEIKTPNTFKEHYVALTKELGLV